MRAMNELQMTVDHPGYQMTDVAPPPATLTHAQASAFGNGLHHPVYTDNVHGLEGVTTFCSGCHAVLVRRDCDVVLSSRIDAGGDARGTCLHCGFAVAGRCGTFGGGFPRRQITVREAV